MVKPRCSVRKEKNPGGENRVVATDFLFCADDGGSHLRWVS